MPEGDTIFRTARTLHRALAGRVITRFESVYPQLTRVDAGTPVAGRVVERVEARGKHVLMWFGAGHLEGHLEGHLKVAPTLVLRTHMRMHGSWHIYRPGERWQRPRHEMRIAIETDAIHAIAFGVPSAELAPADAIERSQAISTLGPDPLADHFDADEAVRRLLALSERMRVEGSDRDDTSIADALLDQSAIAGIGNVYKSEVLFVGRINPFAAVQSLTHDQIAEVVAIAVKLLRANVSESSAVGGGRRTTNRTDPSARLWVYGRGGQPCRRCGTPIAHAKQGPFARMTYWCERCQPAGS